MLQPCKGNCGQSEVYVHCTLIRVFRPIGSHQHSVSQIHNGLLQNDTKCTLYNNYYKTESSPCPVLQEVLLMDTLKAFRIGL